VGLAQITNPRKFRRISPTPDSAGVSAVGSDDNK